MKERELKVHGTNDTTIVAMSYEEQKNHYANLSLLIDLAVLLRQRISTNELDEEFKETGMHLLESCTVDILKNLGYESTLQREYEKRFAEIRNLNVENRELRKQLGGKATAEDVRETLKNLKRYFHDFWNNVGFGFSTDYTFEEYGLKVRICTSMFNNMWDGTPEHIQERKTRLMRYGFALADDDEGTNDALEFSSENIKTMNRLLSEYFSDFRIVSVNSSSTRNKLVYIRDMMLYIYNYDDLIKLGEKH